MLGAAAVAPGGLGGGGGGVGVGGGGGGFRGGLGVDCVRGRRCRAVLVRRVLAGWPGETAALWGGLATAMQSRRPARHDLVGREHQDRWRSIAGSSQLNMNRLLSHGVRVRGQGVIIPWLGESPRRRTVTRPIITSCRIGRFRPSLRSSRRKSQVASRKPD